jgi:Zn-dependent protease with chaperone function
MTMIGFVILVILVMLFAYLVIALGGMPGKTARERGHPQADAINMLGWLGLLFGGVGWVIAMVWSRMKPLQISSTEVVESGKTEDDLEAS